LVNGQELLTVRAALGRVDGTWPGGMLPSQMTLFVKWSTTVLAAVFGGAMAAYWANISFRNENPDFRSVMFPLVMTIGVVLGAKAGMGLGRAIIKD
jgi:hypothetical protein